jgi:cell division protein FtsB
MSEKSTESKTNNVKRASRRAFRQRPLLSFPQIVALTAVVVAIYIGVDLNHRARIGRLIEASELSFQEQLDFESTRQVELMVTRTYVNSDDYVADFARNEGGQVMPGERRIVPITVDNIPLPTPVPTATPDPAYDAQSWQAWWRLFSDAPLPSP